MHQWLIFIMLPPRDLIQVARCPVKTEVIEGVEVTSLNSLRDPSAEVLEDRAGELKGPQGLSQLTPIGIADDGGLGRAVHDLA